MTVWPPSEWSAAVVRSGFELRATYDGELADRPRVETERSGTLLWHELTRLVGRS